MKKDYQHLVATDIQVLSTMQAIRKRPGMYTAYKKDANGAISNQMELDYTKFEWAGGVKDPHSLTRLIMEAMCLSRAFVAAGKATEIEVRVDGNNVLVYNNGTGISMEKKISGFSLIEVLLTQLHACKNIKHDDIKDFCESGIVVVNALSEFLEVLNVVDNVAYVIHYAKGELEEGPFVAGTAKHNGLAIEFKFDSLIFGDLKIDKEDLIAAIEKIRPSTPATINLIFDN